MHTRTIAALALLTLATVAVAGCTGGGNFDVRQTEPLRVRLEGNPVQTNLDSTNSQREIIVEKAVTTQIIRLNVDAQSTQNTNPIVIVIVKDKDSGVTLGQKELNVQNNSRTTFDVDVKGKNNVVVITQVQGGSAIVNVAAQDATSQQVVQPGTTTGGTNQTATNTTSSTTTNTNTTTTTNSTMP
jgi:hypothetical protein